MSLSSAILIVSTGLQFAAAIIAIRLMRTTGRRVYRFRGAWGFVAAGVVLIAAHRSVVLYRSLQSDWGNWDKSPDLQLELLGLVVSACLFAGLAGMAPLFRAFRQSEEELRKAHAELEMRVRDRTAELATANDGLQQERYLLNTLMDYLPQRIYFKDARSRFIRINQATAHYFGLQKPQDAIGKTDVDYFTDEHALQALADEQEIVRSGQGIVEKEEKETWTDGRATWASSTKMPLYDDAGKIVGTFGITQDVTTQKRAAETLRAAKEAAEAANRAKSSFLANMSHEIRTPLNAVIGMTELVLKSELTSQQREYLSTVRDSGQALLSQINDILDFSKIEAEKLVLESQKFHLRESLGDTLKAFAFRAHQQGLELACNIQKEVPTWVIGDYHRLRQVVVNLVNNAIKFTESGEVVLEVAPAEGKNGDITHLPGRPEGCFAQMGDVPVFPADADHGYMVPAPEGCPAGEVQLHFTVSDTGIGIPSEKHALIFGMFEQADSSTTRRFGGTGLGLAIASHLVALMGGRIWVESEVGRGSRFHFTVRLGLAEADSGEVADSEPRCLHGMRVLAVDDNATNRRILDAMLTSWQMLPTSVASAAEAVQLLRQAEHDGRPFPLVITDAHMPDIDGFMLAGQIRQEREIDGPVVMMLTSGDRPNDMGECERLGIAAYLLKPIKQSEMLEAIQVALGILGTRRAKSGAVEPRRWQGRSLRILLAEDSLVNQQLARALLEGEGHSVVVANNGREAVTTAQAGDFDLVLMDLQMPEMDGLEATAMIRAEERSSHRHLPIIAMTAHALKGDRERCLEAGMDGYTSKPIDANELFAAIENLVIGPKGAGEAGEKGRKGERENAPCSLSPFLPFSPAPSSLPRQESIVDWCAALKAVRGDRELLNTIVATALDEIPKLVTEVRRAAGAGDSCALRLAAHTLKGSVRYFGAPRVMGLAEQLEAMGQKNDLTAAGEILPVLEQSAGELTAALSQPVSTGAKNLSENGDAAATDHTESASRNGSDIAAIKTQEVTL